MFAVVADTRPAGGELTAGVAFHDPVEVGVADAAESGTVVAHEQLGSHPRSFHHGGEGHRPGGPDVVAQRLVDRHHQSSGSMKRWIVPPQVSPTANASSSE